uniref:Reticulon-3-like n=1 Tax=Drosophila rhopaloa TaxID=1041015 RepID=A0A6P4E4N5_DRORH
MATDSGSFPVLVPNAELDKNIFSCIGEKITHLILWRDWRKSVLVFIVLQAIVFDLTNESAISVMGVWGLFGLWITVGYRFYVRCLQCFNKTKIQGNPYQKYLDVDMNIAKEPSKQMI